MSEKFLKVAHKFLDLIKHNPYINNPNQYLLDLKDLINDKYFDPNFQLYLLESSANTFDIEKKTLLTSSIQHGNDIVIQLLLHLPDITITMFDLISFPANFDNVETITAVFNLYISQHKKLDLPLSMLYYSPYSSQVVKPAIFRLIDSGDNIMSNTLINLFINHNINSILSRFDDNSSNFYYPIEYCIKCKQYNLAFIFYQAQLKYNLSLNFNSLQHFRMMKSLSNSILYLNTYKTQSQFIHILNLYPFFKPSFQCISEDTRYKCVDSIYDINLSDLFFNFLKTLEFSQDLEPFIINMLSDFKFDPYKNKTIDQIKFINSIILSSINIKPIFYKFSTETSCDLCCGSGKKRTFDQIDN